MSLTRWFKRPSSTDLTDLYLHSLDDMSFNAVKHGYRPANVRHGCRHSLFQAGRKEICNVSYFWKFGEAQLEVRIDTVSGQAKVIETRPMSGVRYWDRSFYKLASREDYEQFRKLLPAMLQQMRDFDGVDALSV